MGFRATLNFRKFKVALNPDNPANVQFVVVGSCGKSIQGHLRNFRVFGPLPLSFLGRYSLETLLLAPVVQKLDNAIHRINHYPADSVVCFVNIYPLDSDLSGG